MSRGASVAPPPPSVPRASSTCRIVSMTSSSLSSSTVLLPWLASLLNPRLEAGQLTARNFGESRRTASVTVLNRAALDRRRARLQHRWNREARDGQPQEYRGRYRRRSIGRRGGGCQRGSGRDGTDRAAARP